MEMINIEDEEDDYEETCEDEYEDNGLDDF
jgi:hypothetical protein